MSCAIDTGYTRSCRNEIGGIRNVYITELANKNTISPSTGEITSFTLNSGKRFWKYELEIGVGTASDDPKPNAPNGTFYFEQNVSFTLPKRSVALSNAMKNLAVNDLMIIVETNKSEYYLMGQENGMKMADGSTGPFGTAFADMNGYNLVFQGMEPNEARKVASNLIATLTQPA
jgi:hypothetical protein